MPLRVLVVDDSAMSRKLTIKALPSGWDAEIAQATNGREALEVCRAGKVQVMFLDLTMPEVDGFEVLETLRREAIECFVVVISADIQPKAQQRCRELGAAAFLKKPVKTEEIGRVLTESGYV